MKIKLLTSVAIAGNVCKSDTEIEVSNSVGRDLVNRRRAISLEAVTEAKVIDSHSLTEPTTKRGRKSKFELESQIADVAE